MSKERDKSVEVDGAKVFGSLTINERVLETPARTISIDNIASITVGVPERRRKTVLIVLAVASLVVGAAVDQQVRFGSGPGFVSYVSYLAALGLAVAYFLSGDKNHYLIISTNDGLRTMFSSPRESMLQEVRAILTDKINTRNESATYEINFANATIQSLQVGQMKADAIVHGDNNQLAVNSPGSRVGSPGGDVSIQHSPGAQVGRGHVARDVRNTSTVVNYDAQIPHVLHMRDFYAGQPGQAALHHKLDELLTLMRTGTPDPRSRARVRDLASEASSILQAYPAVVQIFRDVMALAVG